MEHRNCPVDGCTSYIPGPVVYANTVGQKPAARRDCPKCGTALVYWQHEPGWRIDEGEEQSRRHARGDS